MSMGVVGVFAAMTDVATYADWLRGKRLALGITQQQLADATGIHRTYIIRMEKPGHIDLPALETRQKVHAALGTTEDELIALGIVRPRRGTLTITEPSRPDRPPVILDVDVPDERARHQHGPGYRAALAALSRMSDEEAALFAKVGESLIEAWASGAAQARQDVAAAQ
jgi:transcriptional regulator with XRE-family HTH domain